MDRNRQLLQEPFLSYVALRKESVDRNTHPILLFRLPLMSLSARRAWIEMIGKQKSVDEIIGRSPQGERG